MHVNNVRSGLHLPRQGLATDLRRVFRSDRREVPWHAWFHPYELNRTYCGERVDLISRFDTIWHPAGTYVDCVMIQLGGIALVWQMIRFNKTELYYRVPERSFTRFVIALSLC